MEWKAKDDEERTRFADDRTRKRAMLTPQERRICEEICGNLLERLDLDPHNLFVSGRGYQQEPVARMHEDHHP
ncbi:MAG: hypothetical protein D6757_06065 [Alphaproteobacteria bacterium]|nr:MAG: hypothetical protein D6757_06065 [Alphaproteobacteria bacterium]